MNYGPLVRIVLFLTLLVGGLIAPATPASAGEQQSSTTAAAQAANTSALTVAEHIALAQSLTSSVVENSWENRSERLGAATTNSAISYPPPACLGAEGAVYGYEVQFDLTINQPQLEIYTADDMKTAPPQIYARSSDGERPVITVEPFEQSGYKFVKTTIKWLNSVAASFDIEAEFELAPSYGPRDAKFVLRQGAAGGPYNCIVPVPSEGPAMQSHERLNGGNESALVCDSTYGWVNGYEVELILPDLDSQSAVFTHRTAGVAPAEIYVEDPGSYNNGYNPEILMEPHRSGLESGPDFVKYEINRPLTATGAFTTYVRLEFAETFGPRKATIVVADRHGQRNCEVLLPGDSDFEPIPGCTGLFIYDGQYYAGGDSKAAQGGSAPYERWSLRSQNETPAGQPTGHMFRVPDDESKIWEINFYADGATRRRENTPPTVQLYADWASPPPVVTSYLTFRVPTYPRQPITFGYRRTASGPVLECTITFGRLAIYLPLAMKPASAAQASPAYDPKAYSQAYPN